MAKIVYETHDDILEITVSELKYKEEIDCWWYYVGGDDEGDGGKARYVPRDRVFYVERGG